MTSDTFATHQDNAAPLETDETGDMISSRKVQGTAVYGHNGEKLGSIESFMVNKASGQVEYAVLEFGGLFGIGSDHYPLPWNQLRYSPDEGGYAVDLDRNALEKAPRYNGASDDGFDPARSHEIDTYYSTI